MSSRKDPVRELSHVVVYAALYLVPLFLGFGMLLVGVAGTLAGMTVANLAAALFANWLALKIYKGLGVSAIGLWWNRAGADNFALGLVGGVGAVSLLLAPALLFGAAHFKPASEHHTMWAVVFLGACLLVGSAAEEILFRGFGFQTLLPAFGPIPSVGFSAILFGALHLFNPHATLLGAVNTAGFGALFGYAFLRSHDLWLPIGMHFGWNFTLSLFGEPVSGLTMNVTGHEMSWTAGALWSGGEYGPEASALVPVVLVLLFLYIRRAPARRQSSPLAGPDVESAVCEPPLQLPS
jgi:membrane protease YdiL (CAAX protease family)